MLGYPWIDQSLKAITLKTVKTMHRKMALQSTQTSEILIHIFLAVLFKEDKSTKIQNEKMSDRCYMQPYNMKLRGPQGSVGVSQLLKTMGRWGKYNKISQWSQNTKELTPLCLQPLHQSNQMWCPLFHIKLFPSILQLYQRTC